MNKTDAFIDSIRQIECKDVSPEVMERAKRALLDYIGVALAGSAAIQQRVSDYIRQNDIEEGNYTVIGMKRRFTLKDAVFLNGLYAHALDYDDGTNAGIIHLGSPIFSVLLPLAECYHVDGRKLLKAAIIGYETSFTMAVSIQPKHKLMGYHATGTCGILGIVMAVSYLLDFTEEKTKNAFTIACASATGMLSVLDDGSELKPYNVAKTALLGLISVQMAMAGFVGNPDALGSYRGYLKMMTGDEGIELKKPLLNGTYAIEKAYTKPYAACRYCHPSIEAAVDIRSQYGLHAEDISSIQVYTYDLAVKGHEHMDVRSSSSAKMSIPYSVAVGLIYGKAGLQEYEDSVVKDERTITLTKKVTVLADEKCSVAFPEKQIAIVKILMNSGICFEKQIDFPKGEPENPLTEDEFSMRFIELAAYGGKSEEQAKKIIAYVKKLDGEMNMLFGLIEGGDLYGIKG